jgi:fluoride exporter
MLAVAAGSAAGGALRYSIGEAMAWRTAGGIPLATLLVNVAGSLLLGLLLRWFGTADSVSPAMRLALTTGLCGGFTTFSTFSLETVRMAQGGSAARALAYVFLSVVLCLAATVVGLGGPRRLIP